MPAPSQASLETGIARAHRNLWWAICAAEQDTKLSEAVERTTAILRELERLQVDLLFPPRRKLRAEV